MVSQAHRVVYGHHVILLAVYAHPAVRGADSLIQQGVVADEDVRAFLDFRAVSLISSRLSLEVQPALDVLHGFPRGHALADCVRRLYPDQELPRMKGAQPGSETERLVAGAIAHVLGRDDISIDSRFFEMGLSSLDLVAVQAALGERLGTDIPLMTDPGCFRMRADTLSGRIMLRMRGRHPRRKVTPFSPTIDPSGGLDFAAYGGAGEAVMLPGHTPGSIGVLYDGCLIAGDAVYNIFAPCRSKFYCDGDEAGYSYRRILSDDRVSVVYPGHGRPIVLNKNKPMLTPVTE